jgi:micrococcal nuclease
LTAFGDIGRCAGALLLLAILLYLLLSGGSNAPSGSGAASGQSGVQTSGSVTAKVVRVVDGDTIEVSIDGSIDGVRYIGVDTPETVKPGDPVECYGPEASDYNHQLVDGETVRLVFDHELRDIYGRLLAYVFVGNDFINEDLVRGGYARTLEIEPNTTRADHLAEVAGQAGEAGRGLWSAC